MLLTSVGGAGVPRLLDAMRAVNGLDAVIIGVDAREDAIGAHFADEFYRVPHGSSPEYADTLLRLCSQCHIQVIVPLSDEEALQLSAASAQFERAGITILGSSYETTVIASNKFRFLSHLKDRGIETPLTFLPNSVEEAKSALEALGFPYRPVVLKPVQGQGSRGFRLVVDEVDEFSHILMNKKETLISARRLLEMLNRRSTINDFILMEYLDGHCYSVDVLVDKTGKSACVIPQRKLNPRFGSLESGRIEKDQKIQASVERIIDAFDFRYIVNIDMAYRASPAEGPVLPFDLNVRPSAVIAATQAAGCFLLAEALFMALGIDHALSDFHSVQVDRFWAERYEVS